MENGKIKKQMCPSRAEEEDDLMLLIVKQSRAASANEL